MKRLYALLIAAALCFPSIGAMAWWQSIQQVAIVAAPTYQGPGDVVSGAGMWGSCARVYNAAAASTATSLCDLVAVTTPSAGAVVCTLRGSASGFVDLAASYCNSTTPAAACTAAGGCKVTKIYDQSGSSNHLTNATLSQMPTLNFGALNSLPSIGCVNAAASQMATPSITQAQPISLSTVAERTAGTGVLGTFSASATPTGIGFSNITGSSYVTAGGTAITEPATENSFHSVTGVLSSTVGANNTDGTDSGSANNGTNSLSSTLRICRSSTAISVDGQIMEVGYWPLGFNATQRGNMSTNQHGANGYNF